MREWLAFRGGVRRVVTVGDELVVYAAYRPIVLCSCGRLRLGSGRTCGSQECVALLHLSAATGQPRGT